MRVRVSISAEEAVALEDVGREYDMSIQQVATIVVRRIGVKVNQIAHAVNRLLADLRFRRQDEVVDQLAEIGVLKNSITAAMTALNGSMGLDRAFWGPKDARQADALELLPHPFVEMEYTGPDPP